MKRLRTMGTFFCGVLVGIMMISGVTAYVTEVLAERSTQPIYVDGVEAPMTAYAIDGNNYVKLRDIGKAVDFNVSYEATTDSVKIDSNSPYVEETPSVTSTGAIILPDGDAKLNLKEGDIIRCDDGTDYTITDMSRYDASMFAEGPLPPLPTATCDWSSFPDVELPEIEVRRFNHENGDTMFVRNLYETRRMQYTLWNLAGNNKETSINGKLIYGSKGTPHVRTNLTIPDDVEPQFFWPWKDSQITNLFNSCPIGTYSMEAWDMYKGGIFQHTRYLIDAR